MQIPTEDYFTYASANYKRPSMGFKALPLFVDKIAKYLLITFPV